MEKRSSSACAGRRCGASATRSDERAVPQVAPAVRAVGGRGTVGQRRGSRLGMALLGLLLVGFSLVAGLGRAVAAEPLPQIWMAATEPFRRAALGWGRNDYMELFPPGAPWRTAARHVQVFQIAKQFVERASAQQLSLVIAGLRRRGIALAMQGVPNIATRGCGRGIESYGPPRDMANDAARIKRLGGQLAYISMDEPLFYGHLFTPHDQRVACHAPIATIAADAARKIAAARRIFPSVQVGDTEPFGIPFISAGAWASLLQHWFSAFQAATGQPLAFVHADIVWLRPNAISQFEAAVPVIRRNGIPLGIIYNGTPADPTSAAWVADAKNHIRLIERRLGIVPAMAVFQTWTKRPRQMLPDTAANTLTGLIAAYVAGH